MRQAILAKYRPCGFTFDAFHSSFARKKICAPARPPQRIDLPGLIDVTHKAPLTKVDHKKKISRKYFSPCSLYQIHRTGKFHFLKNEEFNRKHFTFVVCRTAFSVLPSDRQSLLGRTLCQVPSAKKHTHNLWSSQISKRENKIRSEHNIKCGVRAVCAHW